MSSQDAQDISALNSATANEKPEIPVNNGGKKSGVLLWVVLGCVVVGVGLGVFVYQQSLTPSVKPSATPRAGLASPKPVASPVTPVVSLVEPEPKTVTFPKAGKLRVYYANTDMALGIILKDTAGSKTFTIPAGASSNPAKILDTNYDVTAGMIGTIDSYLGSDSTQLSIGWAKPVANQCGFNGFGQVDIAALNTWVSEQAKGEPIVSVQCWGDYSPNPGDTSAKDFNDYILIWSYTPAGTSPTPSASVAASSTPTPTPSVAASNTPAPSPSRSPSPTPTPSKSPSPSPSKAASPSPSASVAAGSTATPTPTPTPSTRAAMPDTTDGVPVTGVFEITVGTVSVGLILLALGLFGLLVL